MEMKKKIIQIDLTIWNVKQQMVKKKLHTRSILGIEQLYIAFQIIFKNLRI